LGRRRSGFGDWVTWEVGTKIPDFPISKSPNPDSLVPKILKKVLKKEKN